MNWHFCPFEEAKLLQGFGLGFREYSLSVRRWL
jgi:protein-S-isoprenylcysteine O-methyltransferase Ste14